jgi:hypothetical protein
MRGQTAQKSLLQRVRYYLIVGDVYHQLHSQASARPYRLPRPPRRCSDLEKTAALCCLLWGGLHNPIIPVATETDGSADELVRTFQVDAVGQSGKSTNSPRGIQR